MPASLPPAASPDEAMVMRQAFAGMLWSKQLYYYDVARWLDGDPGSRCRRPRDTPAATPDGARFNAFDVMSMPDKWEYPWFASWDLAFHCIALAHVDPDFAKNQLLLVCREWFQHPNGALPAYEWDFGDVNPPVQASPRSRSSRSTAAATSTSSAGSSTSCWSTSPGG